MSFVRWNRLVRQLMRQTFKPSAGNRVTRRVLRVEQFEDRVTPALAISINSVPLTGPEGTPIALTSTVTDAVAPTYLWTVVKDAASANFATGTDANFTFTPNDNGSYVVTVTVTDSGATASASDTFTITNVPPTASITGPSVGVRQQTLSFTLGATDPSSVDQAAGFTFAINWGDGSASQTVTGPSGTVVTHTFVATGNDAVSVTATDKDGGVSAAATLNIAIQAVALEADTLFPGQQVLVVGGTAGNDNIVINPGGGHGGVQVFIGGKKQGAFTGAGRIEVLGGDGNDNIQVAGGVRLPAWLFGGAGNDRLKGGNGNDVLVGGDGNDLLLGSKGQDILIGGAGADHLNAGPGDDILIGGTTNFDNDETSLAAIDKIWTGGGSFADRIAALRTGSTALIASGAGATVQDDGAVDKLQGASGHDWIFAGINDKVSGHKKDDVLNDAAVTVVVHGHGNDNGHGHQ